VEVDERAEVDVTERVSRDDEEGLLELHIRHVPGGHFTTQLFNEYKGREILRFEGPLGTFFRYICDNGTYIARYDDLVNGKEERIDVSKVDVSMNGIELQDREFFAAIKEGREPNASVAQVLPCYRTLHELDLQLQAQN